ncbi:EutP/PduV family microcompartment system protein [Listeria sp. FSL L7-1485]|uniref:EutP/PduV family microcompartment system protein n=1 Tax=Listeria immobilis TaxID=2713502 RepID=A0A7X0X8Z4_9LIST|nr:EutP/PduV family microcompartment system protein [Listeria immobilis]MBC1489779.1 EutP/PduV family microcompartment system protein [Listeria immobilis]MBC1536795.1 EutP/PduV family microcompartment system protein [Listeria immobilis]
MKKMMVMGSVGCGKTTLCQKLHGFDILYKKTQAVDYFQEMIDTPGEFVQHRQLYSALTVTAADAAVIAILQSVTEKKQTFSPMFASIFAKPVIGIVTKVDLAESDKDIERAERELKLAGAKKIFHISSVEETGIEELRAYLED